MERHNQLGSRLRGKDSWMPGFQRAVHTLVRPALSHFAVAKSAMIFGPGAGRGLPPLTREARQNWEARLVERKEKPGDVSPG